VAHEKGLLRNHKPQDHKQKYNIKYCDSPLCEKAWEEYQRRADADEVVRCDTMCGAPGLPATKQDYRAAYIHWREHSVTSGCSHGS
jgi:hypothetical protein